MPRMGFRSRVLILLMVSACLLPAATIRYDAVPISAPTGVGEFAYRFMYETTDLNLLAYQELDLRFSAAKFVSLFNPVVGPGVDVLMLQPNNPPGAMGDLSLLALVNNPDLSSFSLDVIITGALPASQSFVIYEYDPDTLELIGTVSSGSAGLVGIPEPSSLFLLATGILCFGALMVRQRG